MKAYFPYIKLHIVIFVWGFTAILGKLISLPAMELVWYRMLIAAFSLAIFAFIFKSKDTVSNKMKLQLLCVGMVVAGHWILFFHAIKVSNVSVTLGCLSTIALFTSILEPIFQRKRIIIFEVVTSLIIIIGLYIIFKYETRYTLGIISALGSAFLAAMFTVLNKQLIKDIHPVKISLYEMIGGFIGISLFMLLMMNSNTYNLALGMEDAKWLLILGVVCTAVAFVVAVDVMKQLSAFTVVLSTNMEPVYGILLAFLFFEDTERMSTQFYIGAGIILTAVFAYPIIKGRKKAITSV